MIFWQFLTVFLQAERIWTVINAGKLQTAVRYVDSGKLGRRDCICDVLKLNSFTQWFAPCVIKSELKAAAPFCSALTSHLASAWQRGIGGPLSTSAPCIQSPSAYAKMICCSYFTWQGFTYPSSSLHFYQQWHCCQALCTSGWDLCKLSARLFCTFANNLHTTVQFSSICAYWALGKGLWVRGQMSIAVYPQWPFLSSRFLLKWEAIKIAFLLRKGCAACLCGKDDRNAEVFSSRQERGISEYVVVAPVQLISLLLLSQACVYKVTHILSCSFCPCSTLT